MIDPRGIKITIKNISRLSFPENLLLKISTMAITGNNRQKIKAIGISARIKKSPIPIYFKR
jgi:hypothetical protein